MPCTHVGNGEGHGIQLYAKDMLENDWQVMAAFGMWCHLICDLVTQDMKN